MQLNPQHLRVAGLLPNTLFRIPQYQRAYSWTAKQRSELFRDIKAAFDSGQEHFMATVVALFVEQRLIGSDEYRIVDIVDGQQRLTSIVVLLKAIEKALPENSSEEVRAKNEIADLLVKRDDHSLLLLQTNHDSSEVFTKYVRSGEIDHDAANTLADTNIVNAAAESEEFVDFWEGSLVELFSTIKNRLSMIYHEVSDEAIVYRVFEVLNSRGLDVKWVDKLKSQLMSLIYENVRDKGSRNEAVREMHEIWKDIYRTLGLRGEVGDEALRFGGTWKLSDCPNRILNQEAASSEYVSAAGKETKNIVGAANDLKRIVKALSELRSNARLRAVTKIVHARFVASAILLRGFPPSAQKSLMHTWEHVTFRIFGLGGADARSKVGEYVRLGYQIIADELSHSAINDRLNAIGAEYEISNVLGRFDVDYCYEGWAEELRYLLFRFDEHLSESAGERLNETQWKKIWSVEAAQSIEHIQPQSKGVSYIHNLGNLTMLPPKVNSSLRDKSPKYKASTYVGSGLRATADVGRTIATESGWNKSLVSKRADEILSFIEQEWK